METKKEKLEFRFGIVGMVLPFLVMAIGICGLAFTGQALPMAFWIPALCGVFLCLVFAKNPRKCADAMVRGIASEVLAIIILALFLAGIVSKLLTTSGLIDGLLWLGMSINFPGGFFPW